MLLSKLSSGWWFGKPWRSCGVTGMTMLQKAILVLQMIYIQLESVDVSFAISQDMPLNKQSSGWGFDTSWRSCGVTGMTMLQNAILVLQMICIQLESVDVSFAISQDMPLNKQSSGWGFDTSWRSCGVTAITMLQNAISVSQMISSPIKLFGIFFLVSPMTCCWANCQPDGDFGCHDARVSSL